MRVILVGKTGLDAALRLDSRIDLVRVATPLEAIGEVADPIDPDSSRRTVVIVAREVELGLRAGGEPIPGAMGPDSMGGASSAAAGFAHGVSAADARIIELVCGLKLADPRVIVMNVGNPIEGSAFDATVKPDAPPAELSRLLRGLPAVAQPISQSSSQPASPAGSIPLGAAGLAGMAGGAPRHEPEPPVVIPPVTVAPPPAQTVAPAPPPGDEALLAAMTRGEDVRGPALSIIRQRCGDGLIDLLPLDEATPHEPPASRPGAQAVQAEGRTVGWLATGGPTPPGVLAAHARWLGQWIAAGEGVAKLRRAAETDPLTGAWNRRYLDAFLAQAIETARSHRHHVTVLLFDIDGFKQFNDRYGHDAGDQILVELVRLLGSVIRPSDRVCRIGGDEFVVVFHEPEGPRHQGSRHPTNVFEIAQRFQQRVGRHTFAKLGDAAPGTLTISGGLASFPWDGQSPEALLKRADELLLQGKRQGKNVLTLGPGAMRARAGG